MSEPHRPDRQRRDAILPRRHRGHFADAQQRSARIAGSLLRRLVVVAPLLSCLGAARAVEWGENQYQAYGGEYAIVCADRNSPRLRITQDALIVERATQRVEARGVEPAFSYFGQSSPPGFQVALMSQMPGREITVLIFLDRHGRYAMVEADRKTSAELGGPLDPNAHYRDCDAPRRERDGAAALAQERLDAQAERAAALASPLADARFRRAYRRALGARWQQRWLAEMNGPSPHVQSIDLNGRRYTGYAFCKPHDCHDHNIVLLYDAVAGKAYGALFEPGTGLVLLNAPPPALAAELQRTWRSEWRQGN